MIMAIPGLGTNWIEEQMSGVLCLLEDVVPARFSEEDRGPKSRTQEYGPFHVVIYTMTLRHGHSEQVESDDLALES
jgi:hypothetical protein